MMRGRRNGPSRSERVYEVLLVAYPKEYRREYGALMAQAFGDLCREQQRRAGLALLWGRTVLDLLASAFAERSRTAMPALSSRRLIRLGGTSAMVGGALSLALIFPELSWFRILAGRSWFGGSLGLAQVVVSALIAAGMLGLYAAVVRRSPKLATIGVILVSISAVLTAGTELYRVLYTLTSGYPEGLITPLWVNFVGATMYLVGFLLLAAAVLKARTLGRWSVLPLALLLIPMAFPILFPLLPEGPAGTAQGMALLIQVFITVPAVILNFGWVLLGYLLWAGKTGDPSGSIRVA